MSVDGNWQLVIDSPIGKQHVTVVLVEDAGTVTGTLTNNGNKLSTDIFDGSVNGDAVAWKVTLKQLKMTLTFDTTVAENRMAGKVKAGLFGKFPVTGERVNGRPGTAASPG